MKQKNLHIEDAVSETWKDPETAHVFPVPHKQVG